MFAILNARDGIFISGDSHEHSRLQNLLSRDDSAQHFNSCRLLCKTKSYLSMKPICWALAVILFATGLGAQTAPAPPLTDKEKELEKEDGIPVTSELVRKSCGGCHSIDDKQRMSRISYRRTTPEGWEQTIKRMLTLNAVKLEPAQARDILRYLADHHGLAPEEAKPAAFEMERRMIDYKYAADKDTESTCIKCHSFGRVLSQRRVKGDWEMLIAMHRGYYPLSDFQAFRRMGPPRTEPGPDGRPPDNRHPMDKAIAHLATAFPLKTAEWSAWSANMRAPKLDGRWAVAGYQPGKGPVYGEVTIEPGPSSGEFKTHARLNYARTGAAVTRDGSAIVYTGFQWRGRTMESGVASTSMREVMFVDRNLREMTGRWFNGTYNENGIDVKLTRAGGDPVVLGLDKRGLKAGATTQVKVFGANLPANIPASAIDFGQGVRVTKVVNATPQTLSLEVAAAKDAPVGARDVFIAGTVAAAAAVVYDRIDAIKVRPQAGMARVGGIVFPKQYQQFEAFAYHNGPDGKPNTPDDIDLGHLDVIWSVEEYTATFGDDDKDYIGTLDQTGLFTPNVDGPNPKRKGRANNYGDVWVVASYTLEGGKKLQARAHLLVTVPLYMRFEQGEVAP